jgi:hypothetical protein
VSKQGKPGRKSMIWLGLGIVAVEALAVAGLVMALSGGGGDAVAQIAVCVALIIVPILFGIAVRSEIKGRRDKP